MQADYEFPKFVGHRRRLPPDDQLFHEGNVERELFAKQLAIQDSNGGLDQDDASKFSSFDDEQPRYSCGECKAQLPSEHLLSIHVAETHDSFFAAQAARKHRVYQCLVEGCRSMFASLQERTQHLTDTHRFPTGFGYGSMHLQRHQGQIRPVPPPQHSQVPATHSEGTDNSLPDASHTGQSFPAQHRTPSGEPCVAQRQPNQGWDEASWHPSGIDNNTVTTPLDLPLAGRVRASSNHGNATAEGSTVSSLSHDKTFPERNLACNQQSPTAKAAPSLEQPGEQGAQLSPSIGSMHVGNPCPSGGEAMQVDSLVAGVSRLSVAAEDTEVPKSFSFGRRRGRGRMSRGRQAARRGT